MHARLHLGQYQLQLRAGTLVLSGLLLLTACTTSGPDRATCDAPPPPLPSLVQTGRVALADEAKLRVGPAHRDGSVTVVAFCRRTSGFPRPAPKLVERGREIAPVGGELQQQAEGWVNFYYYPATNAADVGIVQGSATIGRIAFDGAPPSRPCPLRATPPVETVTCGAVVIVEWRTPLRVTPSAVDLMDVDVVDARTGRMLGFMQQGYATERGRLTVTFGFRRPKGTRVELRLRYLYVDDPELGHPRERSFEPPLERSFSLKRVG